MPEEIEVTAAAEWNATPIWVQPGDTLHFRSIGTWYDAFIACSADGYRAPLFYSLSMLPRIPDDGRYFRLMGRVVESGAEPIHDDIAETFVIGSESVRTFDKAGRLFVFANDHKGFYWNNFGSVTLVVNKQNT